MPKSQTTTAATQKLSTTLTATTMRTCAVWGQMYLVLGPGYQRTRHLAIKDGNHPRRGNIQHDDGNDDTSTFSKVDKSVHVRCCSAQSCASSGLGVVSCRVGGWLALVRFVVAFWLHLAGNLPAAKVFVVAPTGTRLRIWMRHTHHCMCVCVCVVPGVRLLSSAKFHACIVVVDDVVALSASMKKSIYSSCSSSPDSGL